VNLIVIGAFVLGLTTKLHALALEIGAFAGAGDIGTYSDYIASLTDPTETDTAVTSGTILVAGIYENINVTKLGSSGSSQDYSDFKTQDAGGGTIDMPTFFDGHAAILLASVPDGTGAAAFSSLMLDSMKRFSINLGR